MGRFVDVTVAVTVALGSAEVDDLLFCITLWQRVAVSVVLSQDRQQVLCHDDLNDSCSEVLNTLLREGMT